MFAKKGVDALKTVVNAVLRGSLSVRCDLLTRRRSLKNNSSRHYLALLLATPLLAVLTACSTGSNDDNEPFVQESQVPFPYKSLEVDPGADTAAVGTTAQFVATGITEDGRKEALTTRVSWTVEDDDVAQIDLTGLATAITPGRTIITATYSSDGRELVRLAGLTVTSEGLVSISVAAGDPSIVAGTSTSLTATGNFSDGSTQDISDSVSWQSSNAGIVAVDASNGDAVSANGIAVGSASITAELNGQSDTVNISVTNAVLESIAVTPLTATLVAGTQRQFTATGSYSDGSTQSLNANVSWQSSNTSVASVGDDAADGGLATAVEAGETTISATLDGISGSANLTVTGAELASIAVTPVDTTIAAGTEQRFTAVGRFSDNTTQDLTDAAVWSSSNENVAAISNADGREGLATARREGPTTITASLNGVSGSTELTVGPQTLVSIDVTPTNPTVVSGTTQQFTATGNYSNGNTQNLTNDVSWQSSNSAVATITGTGLATADAAGSSTITASMDGISDDTNLTVTVAELRSLQISPDAPTVTLGETRQLTATGTYSDDSTQDLTTTVTWGPASSNIASVSNADDSAGLATASSVGTVTVSATSGGISDETVLTVVDRVLESLTVTPDNSSQTVGGQQQFTATGNYNVGEPDDLTDAVEWSSTDTGIATIANADGSKGLANAVAAGTTRIEARLDNVVGGTDFSVIPATLESLSVAPAEATVADGESQQFTATGNYSDGEARDVTAQVTWESANGEVASISSAGLATTTGAGETEITATLGEEQASATLTVTVAERTLTDIQVTPTDGNVDIGAELQYTATGIYSDESTEDLTTTVTWSSADDDIASISDAGLALGNSPNSVTISATFEGLVGDAVLVVNDPGVAEPTLLRVEVTPLDQSIEIPNTLQYTATAFYTDGTEETSVNRTSEATWTSSNEEIASISDDPAQSRGLATGTSEGTVTITATFEGFTDETSLEVRPEVVVPTLTGITIAPQDTSILEGATQQYAATGSYSNDTTAEIPASDVTWSSSNPDIAQFDGTDGVVTGNVGGTVTITATFGGFTDETSLEVQTDVVEPTLTGISIAPQNASIVEGETQQYTATGSFSNDTTAAIPAADVTWSSSDPDIADFSGLDGIASGNTGGPDNVVTITATYQGFDDTATLAVTVAEPTLTGISIAPQSASIVEGATQQYTATGSFSNDTTAAIPATDVTWNSSDTAVADFSGSDGLATGISGGPNATVTITATYQGFDDTATLAVTVEEPTLTGISIAPQNASIVEGATQQYTATGSYSNDTTAPISSADVTWNSSDPAVADFNGSDGLATGISGGPNSVTTITATYQGFDATTNLSVTANEPTLTGISIAPQDASIVQGATQQYTATGSYSNDTTAVIPATDVAWSSSNPDVAQFNGSDGLVTGNSSGSVVITGTFEGQDDTADLQVSEEVTLTGITIAPRNAEIEVGENQQYSVTGNYSNNTTQPIDPSLVTWSSSNEDIAELVDVDGLVLGSNPGTSTIGAVYEDQFTDETEITVIEEVVDAPDLVTRIEVTGDPTVNGQGNVELPISVTVLNQGSAGAGSFKVAVEYTSDNTGGAVVIRFAATGQENAFYPFIESLDNGADITLNGTVTFLSSARESTVSVRAIADSCSGDEDEIAEPYCRVDESDENNNLSNAVTVNLP